LDELRYGILMAMFGLGATVAALWSASRRISSRSRTDLFAGVWLMAGGVFALSLTTDFTLMSLAMIVGGFGAITFVSTGNTVVQLNVADSVRGRVMGIWALGFGACLPLGSFLAGSVAEWIGPFLTIRLFAWIQVVISVILFMVM